MRRGLIGGALAAALLAAASLTGAGARAAPVESYGRLPDIEDVGLSPDGTRLAFAGAQGDSRVITVTTLGSNQPPLVLQAGAAKLRSLTWIDDNDLLIIASSTSIPPVGFTGNVAERSAGFVYDLRKRQLTQLVPPPTARALDQVLDNPMVRVVGGHAKVFFTAWTFDEGRTGVPTLFVYDLDSGMTRTLDRGTRGHQRYLVDRTGDPVAENTVFDQQWMVRVRSGGGGWRHLPSVQMTGAAPTLLGLDAQGKSALFFGTIDGKTGWQALSLETGAWSPSAYTGTSLLTDGQSGLGVGLMRENDHKSYSFFDADLQKAWDMVLRAFPGEQVDFISTAADHKKLVVKVFGQKSGAVYMLVNMATGHVDPIGDLYHDIPPEQVAQTREIAYAAADGLRIAAYLTLPKGRAAKGLPLVVLPHEGPRERDDLAFNWMAQALASRGYAVLQPEYRGSRMGPAIAEAGFGQWGRKMQTDLSDGVNFLAGQGVIDAKRVCIAGAGYGGYAALAGVTLQSGIYRCAVDFSGQSDLKRMVQWSTDRNLGRRNATIAYWDRYMQAEGQRDPSYGGISPIDNVAQVSAPVLIIHGRDDTVVPFEQSQSMVNAMQAVGKPVEFLPLAGEDHWLSSSQTRKQMLTAMVRFIETNNPPDPATAVAASR